MLKHGDAFHRFSPLRMLECCPFALRVGRRETSTLPSGALPLKTKGHRSPPEVSLPRWHSLSVHGDGSDAAPPCGTATGFRCRDTFRWRAEVKEKSRADARHRDGSKSVRCLSVGCHCLSVGCHLPVRGVSLEMPLLACVTGARRGLRFSL